MGDIRTVSIGNEKNVTADDILREADSIWAKCKEHVGPKSNISDENVVKKLDSLLADLQKEHKDFAGAYPTVLRHMVQELQYNHKVFQRYLAIVEKKPWTNDNERMDSYTDYAVLMYRERCRREGVHHANATEVAAFRKDYRRRLQSEHDNFVDTVKKFQKEVEDESKRYTAERRVELTSAFKRLSASANIPENKIAQVLAAIADNKISTPDLEQLVYNIRRSQAGVSYETIVREREEMQRKVAEKLANTVLPNIPEKTTEAEEDVLENIKKIRLKQVQDEINKGE